MTATQPLPYWLTPTVLTNRGTETEPNDTTHQANLVTGTDIVMCGAINATTDLTHFIFTLSQAATMHAEVIESTTSSATCESGTADSHLELLSGVGLSLRTDTTTGRGSCSRLETPAQLMPGTSFLRVSEVSTLKSGFPYCVVVRLR
jgi:hypothetical protein